MGVVLDLGCWEGRRLGSRFWLGVVDRIAGRGGWDLGLGLEKTEGEERKGREGRGAG